MIDFNTSIVNFINANPAVNLQTADLFSKTALSSYTWPAAADQKLYLQNLRTRQRLLKIYPDDTIATALQSLGFHSAHHIASVDGTAFAQQAAPAIAAISNGKDAKAIAQKIYGNAQRIRRTSFELALAQPQTMQLAVVEPTINGVNPDFQEGIPDYERLFGPIISCDCEECQNIFGPAAYFTDLMRVVTQYVTPPLEELFTLQYRRPDLWSLPLDCTTAETEVSYLDIVNTILQQNLQTNYTNGANVLQTAAALPYPFSAPYNKQLATVRDGLEGVDSSLAQLYKLLNVSGLSIEAEMLNLSAEQLSLVTGTDSFTLAQKYGFHNTTVSDAELCTSLSNQKIFLQQTGLQPDKLEQLIFQNLKRGETGYAMYDNGSRDIATDSFTEVALGQTITAECWIFPTRLTGGYITIFGKGNNEEFNVGIQGSKIVCSFSTSTGNKSITSNQTVILNRWMHLAWSRNTVTGKNALYINGALDTTSTLTANENALVSNDKISIGYITGSSYAGAISEIRLWTTERTEAQIKSTMYARLKEYTQQGLYAYWPLNETGGATAYDLGPHHHNATNPTSIYFTQYDSLPFGGANEMNPTLLHSLFINGALSSSQYITLSSASIETTTPAQLQLTVGATGSTPYPPNTILNDNALKQLAVYIRLQAQTGWAFDELDWALKSVISSLNIPTQTTINNAVISALGQVAALTKKYNIKIDELSSLWYDIKTYGRGNDAQPHDLWDRVFNTPPLMANSSNTAQADYYRPVYSLNLLFSSPVLSWHVEGSTSTQDLRLGNQLAAALSISADDLYALVKSITTTTVLSLTVEQLSQMYRIARFAKMLTMRVPDFLQLSTVAGLALSNTKQCWIINEVISLCEKAEWMQKSKLSIDQLSYLTSANPPSTALRLPDAPAMNKAQKDMIQSAAQVLITPTSFINDGIDAVSSQVIYNQLLEAEVINSYGLVQLNQTDLSQQTIYNLLIANADVAKQIFPTGYQYTYVNFTEVGDGTATFNFDPFANATIQQNNSFTISFWVKPGANLVNYWGRMVNNDEGGANNTTKSPTITQVQNVAGQIQVTLSYNDVFYVGMVSNYFTDPTEWVYLTWVNNNGYWQVYRNGIPMQFDNALPPVPGVYQQTGTSPTYHISNYFNGAIRDVTIWTSARTEEQIRLDMQSPAYTNQPDLLAWWPMDEGEGAVINNRSQNSEAVNGMLAGSVLWETEITQNATNQTTWISQLLSDAHVAQNLLAIKSLATIAGISADTMAGICWLTSGEVDNSSIFTQPPYNAAPYPYAPNTLLNPNSFPTDDNANSQPVQLRNTYLSVLQRNTAMARWFKLTGQETAGILNYSNLIGNKTITYNTQYFTINQLMLISQYKSIQNLCNKPNGLLEYFRQVESINANTPSNSQLTLLSQLTGWSLTELTTIVYLPNFSTVNFNTITGLRKLANVIEMEMKIGTGIDTLSLISGLATQNLFTTTDVEQYWQNYTDAGATTTALLSGKSGAKAIDNLNQKLAEQARTVCSAWLIWELEADISGVNNPQQLYEYLLIDVNMAGSVKTSFMVAAMNSLQLYVNRCINSLEPGATNNIPQSWWQWMSTYRVWQANREVYLYPENYVDPTLRKFQSEQFKQFIGDISKGQITDDNVKKALATYLESVSEVANLNLVDGYLEPIATNLPGTPQNNQKSAVFLIARSNTEPPTYYTRTLVMATSEDAVATGTDPNDATSIEFGPWQEIALKINSDYISTAVAFGRQFIFWVEQTKVVNTDNNQAKYTTIYATIYYSYRDFNNSWIEPTILKKNILVQVYGSSLPTINYYTGCLIGAQMANYDDSKTYLYHKTIDWNKVTLQMLPATQTSPQAIMAFIGPYVTCDPAVVLPIDEPVYTGMNDEEKQLQAQLYQTALFTSTNKGKYSTVFEPTLLDSSFNSRDYRISIDTTGANFIASALVHQQSHYALKFDVTSSLLNTELIPATSWWPSINNDNLVQNNTSVVDVISGENAQINGNITWDADKYPPIPQALIPNLVSGNIAFDWSVNRYKTKYSFSFWVYLSTSIQDNDALFKAPYTDSRALNSVLGVIYSSGQLRVEYLKSTDAKIYYVFADITPETWSFVTITTNATEVEIYLNGISNRNISIHGQTLNSQDNSLYFGNFPGYAFGFQFHNVALSALQAQQLYQSSVGYIYLSGLHHSTTSIQQVSNTAGIFVFNTGPQAYLVLPNSLNNAVSSCVAVSSSGSHTLHLSYSQSPLAANVLPDMRFVRINTDSIQEMIATLAKTGISGLYKADLQYLPEESLAQFYPTGFTLLPETNYMNFSGAFGEYFWEIFFYAPYLIAEKLSTSQKFSEAEKWFQFIFDPTNQNSPIGYWPLNTEINTKYPDLAGHEGATPHNLSASVQGTPPFSNNERNILTFNGTNSYLSVPYSKALNTPAFTICAWVNLASLPPSESYFTILCSQTGFTGYHLGIWNTGGSWVLKLVINNLGENWVSATSANFIPINKWMFVSGTFDGEHLRVYIEGKQVAHLNVAPESYVLNSSKAFTIGSGNSQSTTSNCFNGYISEVMYFAHALSHGQLSHMYKDYAQLWLNSNFWNFKPFRRLNAQSLYHILNGDAWESSFFQPAEYYTASMQMAVYEYDPFDPDTLARLRVNSWQKATFMRYIQNLINWGDALFTQDTWETLSDATMRYVLAATLLGRIPVKEVAEEPQPTINYNSIVLEYGDENVPPFLIEMENQLSALGANTTLPQQVQSIVDAYFCIPTNKKLLSYWDLVADRLYKIRNGLTITGAQNNIPLYAAPINPAALVAAAANGRTDNTTTVSIPSVPAFRFSYMIAQAKSVVAEVSRLGGELLAALEKKDAEQLAQMQAGYQSVLYNLTAQIKASQINQLHYIGKGLEESLSNAEYVEDTYQEWMKFPLNFSEAIGMFTAFEAMIAQMVGLDVQGVSVPLFLLPTIFGLADGGMNFGGSTAKAGEVLAGIGQLAMTESQLSNQTAQYIRRYEEWELQKNIAANQVKEIAAQITANNYALQAAKQEMVLNQTQLQQSQEVIDFLKTKFTNDELYSWMSGQLSTLYFQMFQLAWSLAQSTQTALQYELNLNQTYLNSAAWNAGYQGLLAADSLSLALQQMENAYIAGNTRKLEIRKTWSMRQNNPQALLTLISTGDCRFDLNELSYDLDFPGHYNRKIKSLSVTIPAVVGPYQNIHATLIQTGNVVATKPNLAAIEYLLGATNTAPTDGSLRINWNPNQEIIISTGINDAGVFQVNFNDEQYLPFEGTGAVSSWSLSIPQAANAFPLRSISDVIVTVEYTAEDAGSAFAAQVTALPPLTNYNGYQYLSMRQLYSAAWFNFCETPVNSIYSLAFELVEQMYPANLQSALIALGNEMGEIALVPVLNSNLEDKTLPSFFMNDANSSWSRETGMLPISTENSPSDVPGKGNPWTLKAESVPSSLLIDGKIDQTKLQDIILIIPFSGVLNW